MNEHAENPEVILMDYRVYWAGQDSPTIYADVHGSSVEDRLLTLFMEDGFVTTINLDATTAVEVWPSE
jgi:hypothetical protein